jgi:hypothetical protein
MRSAQLCKATRFHRKGGATDYGRDDARGFCRRYWPRIVVEQELIDMTKNNVTPAELQQAKALLLRQIPLSEASEDTVAVGYVGRARWVFRSMSQRTPLNATSI